MKGPDPVDNAGERRIPQGGSLQESEFRRPSVLNPNGAGGQESPRASVTTADTPGAQRGEGPQ
ncbi:hypothetical protein N7447_011380 [Penicillium robsamsonii]|uniref:uncharacterized protein n=1 Tax=Penicillium robsamsonii TaxID=1792511 RepID=UPI002549350E|nr:uncharacterized protein N7447_011380 [Penicillium robsamsonii]KAJ5807147.1 hypothetical protein N7447_011380 [Penicillium robsamsonii]